MAKHLAPSFVFFTLCSFERVKSHEINDTKKKKKHPVFTRLKVQSGEYFLTENLLFSRCKSRRRKKKKADVRCLKQVYRNSLLPPEEWSSSGVRGR